MGRAFVALCVAGVAFSLASCSQRGSAISKLSGAEAQRISFGDPQSVQANFTAKMDACWFSGREPALSGYRAEPLPPMHEHARSILIVPEGYRGADAGFEVQFHRYNENTLISTRNFSLPAELAARLKRDIETWIFGRNDCADDLPAPPVSHESAPMRGQGIY